jgi:hypothetical protein
MMDGSGKSTPIKGPENMRDLRPDGLALALVMLARPRTGSGCWPLGLGKLAARPAAPRVRREVFIIGMEAWLARTTIHTTGRVTWSSYGSIALAFL